MLNKLNCVLLIDDDEPTNYFNHIIVRESDCARHVRVAAGADEALRYLSRSGQGTDASCPIPELIFLDLNMPGINGWEFLAQYKNLPASQKEKTKIVMLTTSIDPDDEVKANAYPELAGFVPKPCTNEMIDKIMMRCFPEYL